MIFSYNIKLSKHEIDCFCKNVKKRLKNIFLSKDIVSILHPAEILKDNYSFLSGAAARFWFIKKIDIKLMEDGVRVVFILNITRIVLIIFAVSFLIAVFLIFNKFAVSGNPKHIVLLIFTPIFLVVFNVVVWNSSNKHNVKKFIFSLINKS